MLSDVSSVICGSNFEKSLAGNFVSGGQGKGIAAQQVDGNLAQVDIDQDLVGHWHKGRDNSVNAENIGRHARLRLPVLLKNCSYDWRTDFRMGEDHDEVHFIVPVGDRNVVVTIDGFNDRTTGLWDVTGKAAPEVPGSVQRAILEANSNNRVEIGVRLTEGNQARVPLRDIVTRA